MKHICAILFLLISGINAKSQTHIGLKLGYSNSKPDFGKNSKEQVGPLNYKDLEWIHFGVTSDINLKPKLDLRIELFYIGKGFDATPDLSFINLNNTIALPVLLKYKLVPKFSLFTGVESNYIISYYWIDGFSFQNVSSFSEDEKKRISIGPVFGFDFKFAKKWSLDVRYSKIFAKTPPDLSRIYDRSFVFSIHRYFGSKE